MTSLPAPPGPMSARRVITSAAPIAVLLVIIPFVLPPYETILLSYGLIMAIAALGFNLLGDGLRDALDPRLPPR